MLSRYGPVDSYPYLFVLESDRKLLQAQETGVLENGKSYDLGRLTKFLQEWPKNVNPEPILIHSRHKPGAEVKLRLY